MTQENKPKPIFGVERIREAYQTGEVTYGDLLEITGLHCSELFDILYDLINPTK